MDRFGQSSKEQERMWRIKTELGEGVRISPGALTDGPCSRRRRNLSQTSNNRRKCPISTASVP
jgi:hypothetical protein